jgi:hypothetical protein
MAALKAVEDSPTVAAITPEAIAAAVETFKERQATPLEHFCAELGGVFRFRRLTAQEVRDLGKLAMVDLGKPTQRVDQGKLEMLVVNKASVEPKVTTALWQQLLQLGPMVTGRLSKAVFDANGMGDDPEADAGKG